MDHPHRIAEIFNHVCQHCKTEFSNKSGKTKYCSPECTQIASRKVDRPNKNILQKDIQLLSWTAIGEKYGVSDNAVRKWARSYGLI